MSRLEELINQHCPDGVEYKKLEDCCNILDNKRKPITKGARVSGSYPYYGANGIQDYVENYIFDGIFVLVGEDGSVITPNGTPVVTWAEGKIWVNNHAHIVSEKEGVMLRFLFFVLQTINVAPLIHGNIPKLTGGDFKALEIPVPPLPVQEEIVRILDKFTELENELETELETELEMRQKQYEYYREKLFEFDDSVDYKPLGGDNGICDLVAGATPSKSNPEYWDNGTIPWMSSGEVNNRRVLSTENKITQKGYDNSSTSLVPVHSVVIALAGQGKTRGKVAITEIELCTNQSLCSLICHDEIDYRYLYHYLESKYLDLRNISNGDGLRGGLSLTLLKPYLVPVPDMATQLRIVDLLERYDALNVDISESLPAEIKMRHQQYEYYRDKLLTFKRLEKNAV